MDDAAAFLARYRFGHIYEERVHSPSCRKCQLEAEAKGIKVGQGFITWLTRRNHGQECNIGEGGSRLAETPRARGVALCGEIG